MLEEGFDDFARRHAEELQNREGLAKETKPEWHILKSEVSKFALDGKGIEGHKFDWATDLSGLPLLVLNNVSATLIDGGDRNGVPQNCRVIFSRRPPGPNQMYAEEESRVAAKTWHLEPEIRHGQFLWLVRELLGRRLSSSDLSEKIAEELARYHIQYEAAYGHAR
jgi:hypothetical protein